MSHTLWVIIYESYFKIWMTNIIQLKSACPIQYQMLSKFAAKVVKIWRNWWRQLMTSFLVNQFCQRTNDGFINRMSNQIFNYCPLSIMDSQHSESPLGISNGIDYDRQCCQTALLQDNIIIQDHWWVIHDSWTMSHRR